MAKLDSMDSMQRKFSTSYISFKCLMFKTKFIIQGHIFLFFDFLTLII